MPNLPESESYLLVRTFFDDDRGWEALRALIDDSTDDGYVANVDYVDDRQFEGYSLKDLQAVHPHRGAGWDVMYVADHRAILDAARPVLVVRVGSVDDRPFRCRADRLHEVDANLSLGNLDWDDFRGQIDESGVYGGVDGAGLDESVRYVEPAVAAHGSASADPVTIAVPPDLWSAVYVDLYEIVAGGSGSKTERAIARRIHDRIQIGGAVVPRMRPEHDVVVTFPTSEWAFLRERAGQLRPMHEIVGGPRRDDVGAQIVALLSRHIPPSPAPSTQLGGTGMHGPGPDREYEYAQAWMMRLPTAGVGSPAAQRIGANVDAALSASRILDPGPVIHTEYTYPDRPAALVRVFRQLGPWFTCGGGVNYPNGAQAWTCHRSPDHPWDAFVGDNGAITLTPLDLSSPRRVRFGWNWRLPPTPGELVTWDLRRTLFDHDTILDINLEPQTMPGLAGTLVHVNHSGIPAEWTDDMTALWNWLLEALDHHYSMQLKRSKARKPPK